MDSQFGENYEGDGLRDMYNGVVSRLKGYYHGVRLDFPPTARGLIKIYGNLELVQILICRVPVYDFIDKTLNFLSFGQWDSLKSKYNFDKMFHLFMLVKLSNGHMLRIEKNEVIEISNTFKIDKDTTMVDVSLEGKHITLNELLQNTINTVGKQQVFIYSPWSNNCQRFILDILQSNGLLTEKDKQFIYQDITELVKELPWYTKAIGQKVTDTAHQFNILAQGEGLKKI